MYLGLITGIVVFIVAVTGCLWVFQEEFTREDSHIYDSMDHLHSVTPSQAASMAKTAIPNQTIHGTKYGKPNQPVEVIFYDADPLFYQSVYLDPVNGQIVTTKDHTSGFFAFVLKGHMFLWMGRELGSSIVQYSTLIFTIILVTGIVLWWPKKKKNRGQRFKFKWKPTTGWKRKNFDIHSILGFYVSFLAIIIAFSGLIMAFNWVYYITYKSWGGQNAPQFIIPNNSTSTAFDNKPEPIDSLVPKLAAEYVDYEYIELHYPASDTASIYIEINTSKGTYYDSDYRFFDQYTGEEIETTSIYGKYQNASIADKVIRMNYDIHVGAIGGLAGKIIAFFVSLTIASLPVSGFLLWYGRKFKSKKKTNQ